MLNAIEYRFASRGLGLLAILTSACSAVAPVDSANERVATAVADSRGRASLSLYGLARPEDRGCRGAGFRGFDFWVGRWDVFGGSPSTLAGTNVVTSELDGCAVEEHWTDGAGGRGRSLNTYDQGTGQWNQLWMDASGLAIVIAGTGSRGALTMLGDTPKFIGGPIITNRIAWMSLDGGRRVRQFWEVSEDGRQTWQTAFDGDYQRRDQVAPAAEVINPFCASRPRYQWFNFALGDWTVRRGGPDGEPLGLLHVAKDVSACLVESTFRGRGYRGKAFAAFHFPSLTWHRTWIDEDGVRLAVQGQLVGTAMVMVGQRTGPNRQLQDLRATWSPVAPNQVDETWEVSTDGGSTWVLANRFTLTR